MLDAVLSYLIRNPPDIIGFVLVAVSFIIALSLHEFGHAAAATWQGDPTARLAGRLTINPRSHLDPLGTFMLIAVGFGWGKPVPFAPNKLRSRRFGAALVGIAGPVVNVILAFAGAYLLLTLFQTGNGNGVMTTFAFITVQLNVGLALFNMMPVPPLDGSRVLSALLPPDKQQIVYFLDKWGFLILLLFVFLLFPSVAGPAIQSASAWIVQVTGLLFN
ncbi:MAG: site-2 protease family protein [Actinomycetota bacterium]